MCRSNKQATLYSYVDENTHACFSRTLPDLLRVLEEEAGVALGWLKENHMIANPSKFHALLIKKDQTKTSEISIQGKTIESEDSVKLLGVQLDCKLNFDPHTIKSNISSCFTINQVYTRMQKCFLSMAMKL